MVLWQKRSDLSQKNCQREEENQQKRKRIELNSMHFVCFLCVANSALIFFIIVLYYYQICDVYFIYWFKWQYPATNINCKLYIHRMEAASITSRQFKLNYVELRKLTHVLLDRLTEIMSISSSSATPIYRKLHFEFPWSKRFTTVLGSLNIYIRVNSIERLVNILSKKSFL